MSEKTNVRWLPQYIALGITWGCSFIFIKLGLEFLSPVGVAFGGVALGALTLVTFARVRNIALPRELKTWGALNFSSNDAECHSRVLISRGRAICDICVGWNH